MKIRKSPPAPKIAAPAPKPPSAYDRVLDAATASMLRAEKVQAR